MSNYREPAVPTSAVRLRGKALAALVAVATLCLGLNPLFAAIIEEGNGGSGIIWIEVGDAGDLPGTAQVVTGGALLDGIIGVLDSGTDIDMYKIFITDPENFSAITNWAGTDLSEDNDAQLFLFNEAGFLVAKDDDDGVRTLPAIYAGELTGHPAGDYYLAFDLFNIDPADDPIFSWAGVAVPPQSGPYEIHLTAAQTAMPEPATLALLGLGSLALLRRRR